MKQAILKRLKELGGNISNTKGGSLYEDLLAVTFDTVLYADFFDEHETGGIEIWCLDEFFDDNKTLFSQDNHAFISKLLDKYFRTTEENEEGRSETFWKGTLYTPFQKGTVDFEDWQSFANFPNYEVDLTEVYKVINDTKPDFIWLFHDHAGCPDHYYICLSDPNPDNPTVFGTDHEEFFQKIQNMGCLFDFLNKFLTKEQFLETALKHIEEFIW